MDVAQEPTCSSQLQEEAFSPLRNWMTAGAAFHQTSSSKPLGDGFRNHIFI